MTLFSRTGTVSSHYIRVPYSSFRHYRRAEGALVVFDMTNENTFKSIKRWVESIKEHAAENVVIVIVANKSDLKSEQVITSA